MDYQTLALRGMNFAYRAAGDARAPLVLCLHGFPDTAASFDVLLPQLAAAGFHAVAPCMRGYAPTGLAPDGDYTARALAGDVLALIAALGAERATVIGHDWGAYAAYCAANQETSQEARRIERLVLMSVPHLAGAVNTWAQLKRSWYVWLFQLPWLPERRVAADDFAFIDALYRSWSPAYAWTAAELAPVKAALRAPGGLAAAIAYYRGMFRNANRESWQLLLARTSVPTLLLAGEQDGAVGPEVFVRTQEAFSGPLQFELLAGVGHFPQREVPAQLGARIIEFLRTPSQTLAVNAAD